MDHGLKLISPILEILEIEVSNILYNPGNIAILRVHNSTFESIIFNDTELYHAPTFLSTSESRSQNKIYQ